jgi:hypothetical protein
LQVNARKLLPTLALRMHGYSHHRWQRAFIDNANITGSAHALMQGSRS